MTSNGPGHSISFKTTCPLCKDRLACANAQADQYHCFAIIRQAPEHSLGERWDTHAILWEMLCLGLNFRDSIISWFHLHKATPLGIPICKANTVVAVQAVCHVYPNGMIVCKLPPSWPFSLSVYKCSEVEKESVKKGFTTNALGKGLVHWA